MGRQYFAILVGIVFLYIASPLILPLAMGGVLAVLFFPWLEKLKSRKIPARLGSGILTIGITIVVLLPSSLLIFFVAKAGVQQLQLWRRSSGETNSFPESLMNIPNVHSLMVWITDRFPVSMIEVGDAIQELAVSVGAKLAELLGGVFTQLPGIATALAIIVVSVYFFLVDGPQLVKFVRRNSFFNTQQTDQLISVLEGMCRSVILASFVSGGLQAIVEGIACILVGASNIALIGSLVFVGSFIPVVGSLPITLGVAIQQFVDGHDIAAMVLLMVALLVVGIDNMVRPLFLKGAANLHPLLAFVAAFGGLQMIGFLGVFLGPIVAALFLVTIQILVNQRKIG